MAPVFEGKRSGRNDKSRGRLVKSIRPRGKSTGHAFVSGTKAKVFDTQAAHEHQEVYANNLCRMRAANTRILDQRPQCHV